MVARKGQEDEMKVTYRECDGCSTRSKWIDALPKGWATVAVCGGKSYELCGTCIAPVVADKRQKK